ncbi:proline iminopeptidase-family hydrolase [Pyxidicoccus fallax]|uniref:Proline iminopeptidase-family hydrolase n=2 Tax=Pyxidicoccus fallax TaxID=394095 RepID=A0A848L6P5_9BACT|nr:proline iminopeptidase-family hydrolase [Pyxidicoccus fallax]NPC78341.1 proline iminopeptidase-family hydrolase [Pyxidicoccus fallax]
MKTLWALAVFALLAQGCATRGSAPADAARYFDQTGRMDVLGGGARRIPIQTAKGTFHVWTKRVGNNPTIKLLLLHGGPGGTHEYFEAFDTFLPGAGIEYYYYDQLGSHRSDQPDDATLSSLLSTEHFVEEVEQVRKALGLGPDNFFLLGHSWGGILATEYALKYPQNLRGLVISNMMSSCPAYNDYAKNVLIPAIPTEVREELQKLEAAKDYTNPRYMELLVPHYYEHHILRMPAAQWPEPAQRSFAHINPKVYVPMQGPSEMGLSGILEKWDRSADLQRITVPTLVIGAQHDTMDPKHMEWMAGQVKRGRYLHCPNGSHMAMYDDQKTYMEGLVRFLLDMDAGRF